MRTLGVRSGQTRQWLSIGCANYTGTSSEPLLPLERGELGLEPLELALEDDLVLGELVERLVLLAQRPLDVDRIGHVLEGDERGAVRQRHGREIDHIAVAPLDPAADRRALVDRRDGRAQRLPQRERAA